MAEEVTKYIKNIQIGGTTYGIKAEKDGAGNTIVGTYATKVYVDGKGGVNNGFAQLDENGKVPSSQLPSYVDDIIESDTKTNFPELGESGKIYVAKDTNKTYRWSGSEYIEIPSALALGETADTAYAGDKGAATTNKVDTHIVDTTNPHHVTAIQVGLGNVNNTSDAAKPISTATQTALDGKVDKAEGKGLSTNDYTTAEKNKLAAISASVAGEVLSIVTQ